MAPTTTRGRKPALSSGHSGEHNPYLAHHFQSSEQQEECATLGMWLFLAQEVMFFGGMFCAYAVYRSLHPEAWHIGSSALSTFWGGLNTIILLLSSFTMALAVYSTQVGNTKRLIQYLLCTLSLGILFVVIKLTFEWYPKYMEGAIPGAWWGPHGHYQSLADYPDQGAMQLFYFLYFVMTGMHALHMIIGFAIILVLIGMAMAGKFGPQRFMTIMNFGLYWHFVDIVWVFLFPMFYLVT